MRSLRRFVPAAAAALFLAAAPAGGADFSLFFPRPVHNGVYVDLFGAYEKDHVSGTRVANTWSDLFLKEKLTVFSDGYVYHPRFLRYHLSLSPALKQESYESTAIGKLGWTSSHGLEYDIRLALLPEHPYGLEVFWLRYEPLFREQYDLGHASLSTIRGAEARLRALPWSFRVRGTDEDTESGSYTTNVRTLNATGQYLKDFADERRVSAAVVAAPSRFTNSSGLSGRNFDAAFDGAVTLGRLQGSTNVTWTDDEQEGGGAVPTASRQLLASVHAGAEITRNFRGDASFRYQDSSSEVGRGEGATSYAHTQYDGDLNLRHQLYESLQTTYTLWMSSGHSSTGKTDALSNALSLAYVKLIPDGRVTGGLSGGLTTTDNTGQTSVVDELHAALPVPGTFLLGRAFPDAGSLVVLIRSPQPPNELVRLVENVHYVVTDVGNTLQVAVIALPAEFPVPGTYDFRASYTLTSGSFKLRTTSVGGNLAVTLLRSLVTPYVSYNVVKSDVLEGLAPGGGLNSRVFALGVSSLWGPLRARVEYQHVFWDSGPYDGFRGEVQYSSAVSPTARVNANVSVQQRRFEETPLQRGYVETVTAAGAGAQKYLFERALTLSAGLSYARVKSLYDSVSWAANVSAAWKVGLLDVAAGANFSVSESNSTAYSDQRREHGYYYLRLRRTIF